MPSHTTLHLQKHFFTPAEQTLFEFEELRASAFLFGSGVHGLRLSNSLGHIVVLPYQGQQIWHAEFYGRPLTMRSMFSEPRPGVEYLQTYGAFLIHCGFTAMGVPGPSDSHPLHGELPNAPYQSAQLLAGQDARGDYLAVTGSYQHTVAFNHNYIARPLVKLYAGSSRLAISLAVQNIKRTPMEYMYLAHVNFRPVDHGRLVYSAPCDPQHVRVRSSIPAHIRPAPGYREFLQSLEAHPERHNRLDPGLLFDPEVVFFIDYQAGENGWAHSLQLHPDGYADFISHRPEQLDKGIRWISRTPDQDALGHNLPATAEPEGYTAEKAKGNLRLLPAGGTFTCELEAGLLNPDEAAGLVAQVERILSG